MARVGRLAVLARSLSGRHHEVHFACRHFDDRVFASGEFLRHEIDTVERDGIHDGSPRGAGIYDVHALRRRARQEIELIEAIEPDVVVGDLRPSLSTSAAKCGVPLMTLINAYWSPYAIRESFPVPDHPMVALMGERLARLCAVGTMPLAFRSLARPVNALRKAYGLPKIGKGLGGKHGGLLDILTHGDFTLYPDIPSLVPTAGLPASHRYTGPIHWSPDVPLPPWWDRWCERGEAGTPLVYVAGGLSGGSSGSVSALRTIVTALASMPVAFAVATAGPAGEALARLGPLPNNGFSAPFVPEHLACRWASLVISDGGSASGYRALQAGTPVVGVASTIDQHLAMQTMQERGVGIRVRAQGLSVRAVRSSVRAVLANDRYHYNAYHVAEEFKRWEAPLVFGGLLDEIEAKGLSRRLSRLVGYTPPRAIATLH
ncbi:MAG: nucleotide disphospho-sugar-binding domain-containing protein [Myxococcota bacterium]